MRAADFEAQASRALDNAKAFEESEGYKRWQQRYGKDSINKVDDDETAKDEPMASSSTPSSSMTSSVWVGGPEKYGMLREPKKKDEVPKALVYVGGLRNPHRVIQGLPTVQSLGLRLRGAWDRFVAANPDALKVAELYGTKDCELNEKLVASWKGELKRIFGAKGDPSVRLLAKDEYVTPIDHQLLLAWQ